MTAADPGDGDLATIAAALLDQGRRADALSRLVTVAALFALMVLPAIPGRPPLLLPALLGPVALLGLGEAYLAMRVGFDAALFRRLAAPAEAFDLARLDEALLRLGLIPRGKTGRPIAERIAGARRLLHWQGLMLGMQAVLILAGAGFAVLRGSGRRMKARLLAGGVTAFARLVTGVRGNWQGCLPDPAPRVYFANHRSHGDFVLIWTVLPPVLRRRTRPVAAADYWGTGRLRRFIGERVFDAVLVQREGASRDTDPVAPLAAALDGGASLILFPEGTRNTTQAPLLPFKSGLYRLARACPGVDLVPVWIDNLNRVMPKGEFVPVPLLCTVTFGAPLVLEPGEGSIPFRERSRQALLALAPTESLDA